MIARRVVKLDCDRRPYRVTSQVIVPGDGGHTRESCQYWAKGKQLGTLTNIPVEAVIRSQPERGVPSEC